MKGVNKERNLVKRVGHMWEDTNEIKARTPPIFDVTPPPHKGSLDYTGKYYLILFYLLLFRISLNLNKHLGMVTLDYSSGQGGFNL